MKRISAVIITLNEADNIHRCLSSIENVADEIVIIDSNSSDDTRKIAGSFPKVRFVNHDWEGYSGSKNFGNSIAAYDWILSIDADEALSPELQASIQQIKDNDEEVNYRFARLTNYCGAWIRHCDWYPDFKIRLFNRKNALWVGESVHEKLSFVKELKTVTLKGDCYHYTIKSIEDHFEKVNKYSSLWAGESFSRGKKKGYFALAAKPVFTFFRIYFIKQGFRDGFYGFVISVLAGYSKFQRIAKLIQMHRSGTL